MSARNERIAYLSAVLGTHPRRLYTLAHFQEALGASKSSLSEDLQVVRQVFENQGIGRIETVSGAKGGFRFMPGATDSRQSVLEEIIRILADPARVLPGGFLYLADILSTPAYVDAMASTMASWFHGMPVRRVVTMETKGIPLAMGVARDLDVPLAIARHESKLTDGPALSSHYLSGTSRRVQTISISKRMLEQGGPAIIIDDFIAGGGTIDALQGILHEFGIPVVGIGVALVRTMPVRKKIEKYGALFSVGELSTDHVRIEPFRGQCGLPKSE